MQKEILIVSNRREFMLSCRQKFSSQYCVRCLSPSELGGFHGAPVLALVDSRSCTAEETYFATRFCSAVLQCPCSTRLSRRNSSAETDFQGIGDFDIEALCSPPKPDCEPMPKFLAKVRRACDSSGTVLLLGESGSGKDFTARFIHENSSRRKKPFVNKNIAEINPNLIESVLFGSTRGGYTGAEDSSGVMEDAQDGTLFLDEIAELGLDAQAKLFGVMDRGKFCRVGSTRERDFCARLIFATDANLEQLMDERKFKRQLFYRINVLQIRVPPLREHMEDVPKLAKEFAKAHGKEIAPDTLQKLCSYSWPGNIRQLKNAMERASVFCAGGVIFPGDITF